MSVAYYWIKDKKIYGKIEEKIPYLLDENKKTWIRDNEAIVMDRIMGYDDTEPAGSPYRIGNTDMMDCIERIPDEEIKDYMKNI